MNIGCLPDEILWKQILARHEEGAPVHRGVCKQWKVIIDAEYLKKLGLFLLTIPSNRAVQTYLELKSFVPIFFDSLFKSPQAQSNFNAVHLPNPLFSLKQGFGDRQVSLPDLLKLEEIHQNGLTIAQEGQTMAAVCKCEKKDHQIMPFISRVLVVMIKRLFCQEQPLSSKMLRSTHVLSTVILNTYGSLTIAAKMGNENSVSYFFPKTKDLSAVELDKVFRSCLKNKISLSRRLFEKLISETSFPRDSRNSLDHFLGHAANQNRWLRICLYHVEKNLNFLRQGAKTRLIVDRGGIVRGINSETARDYSELHEAVADQKLEKTAELIRRGDDVNGKDHALRTPLILAARGDSLTLFKLVLENKGDLTDKDCWGLTAMDWCVITGKPQWLRVCKEFKHEKVHWNHAMNLYKEPNKKCKSGGEQVVELLNFLTRIIGH